MAHGVLAEDVVAGEELVGALARQHDLEARVLDRLREPQQRRERRPQRRLLGQLDRARQQLGDVARLDHDARQVGAELLDDPVLEGALVEALVGEAEPERVERVRHVLPGERRGGGRVEPAAEVRGDGDVGAQADAGRVGEELAELLDQLLVVGRAGARREVDVPPAPLLADALGADAQVVSRRELANAREGGALRQVRPRREGLDEAGRIELAAPLRVPQQRLRLGREAEVAAELGEEERSHAEPVAREEELFLLTVPDGEREVAVQALQAVRAPLGVRVRDHLGVGRGREAVAERLELLRQLDVVVDLAVLHHPVAARLVGERLVAAGEVDDREAGVDHPEAAVQVEARAVGAAVVELARHRKQEAPRGFPVHARICPREAAHGRLRIVARVVLSTPFPDGMRVRGLLVDSLAARATETRNMDNTTIERDIRDFLAQNFPLSDEGSELAGSDSLIEAGVIDSTGVLELIEFLEATYEIQIADEEVLPDNLDSIERIGRFVSSKLDGV